MIGGLRRSDRVARVEPWKPADATEEIRRLGNSRWLALTLTLHAKAQMPACDLITSDILFILKNGFVYDDPQAATRVHYFKYKMECETPNSNGRAIRVVLIPDAARNSAKIVTVMWVDEK